MMTLSRRVQVYDGCNGLGWQTSGRKSINLGRFDCGSGIYIATFFLLDPVLFSARGARLES